ncbi:MAG: glycosyl hydrolase, partial [candidate division Zixibacteria bacterium]|nr:glycosyl hydrolase [candidate division Zixibacteria bacterium]
MKLIGPWKVYFPPKWGAPDSVIFKELKSWTDNEHPGIRYFSGTASYETEFEIPRELLGNGRSPASRESRKLYLDLGQFWALGEVILNGQSLGIVWKPPYRVEITKAVKAGQNQLKIEITNTWANRLVGDAHLPPDQRYCRTSITYSGTPGKSWKEIPLRKSG